MPLWVMGDLHLSLDERVHKPMNRFGSRWTDHAEKIGKRWRALVKPEDTVIVPGDISWGKNLDEAAADLKFLADLPGKKLLSEGNHDYWWTSVTKMRAFLHEISAENIDFLHNNAYSEDGRLIAGSRGWFLEENQQAAIFDTDYEKLVNRECIRLSMSLDAAEKLGQEQNITAPPLVFLHFPPVWGEFRVDPLVDVMLAHGVKECWHGHIHGRYELPPYFDYRGIRFTNAAADYLDFYPKPIG